MEVIQRGVSLEEAFWRTLTEVEQAKLKKDEKHKYHPLAWIADDPPTEEMIGHGRYMETRTPLQNRFMENLLSGELIAIALEAPPTLKSRRTSVPAHLWRFLEPDFDKSEASGEGLKLIEIEVITAVELLGSEPIGGGPERSPTPPSINEGIHLLNDGERLVVEGKNFYFRGPAQKKVLRALFEAYKNEETLKTKILLKSANTEVNAFAKLFGSRRWKELRHVIQQDNGYCWLGVKPST
jgi:hypothetical protein